MDPRQDPLFVNSLRQLRDDMALQIQAIERMQIHVDFLEFRAAPGPSQPPFSPRASTPFPGRRSPPRFEATRSSPQGPEGSSMPSLRAPTLASSLLQGPATGRHRLNDNGGYCMRGHYKNMGKGFGGGTKAGSRCVRWTDPDIAKALRYAAQARQNRQTYSLGPAFCKQMKANKVADRGNTGTPRSADSYMYLFHKKIRTREKLRRLVDRLGLTKDVYTNLRGAFY